MVKAIGSGVRSATAILFALWLAACGKPQEATTSVAKPPPPAIENTSDPQWIHRDPQRPNNVAVVFVHGIFGDTKGTWTREGGPSFFDYLHESPTMGSKVDIYAFGFSSHMLANGSLKIGEAANKMHDYLKADGVDRYPVIVFVAHSMGGLVTMRELINHDELRAKVPLLVFYATPHEGAQITKIGQYLLNNQALKQMLPVDANDYLEQINEDWVRVTNSTPRPVMVCAYEKKPVAGAAMIVPWASSTRNCSQVASAIEDSDHISIVKPDRAKHPSVIVLGNALNDFVAPLLDSASIDTPSFDKNEDPWIFRIENAGKRNTAVLESRVSVSIPYSLEAVDSSSMLVPQTMPRQVEARGRDAVDMVLLGALRKDYQLRLRIGAMPERIVIARIPDMTAALSQRGELESATAGYINGYFASGDNQSQFRLLSGEQQQQKLSALAEEAIKTQQPGLPDNARLVLAANTLNGLNLSRSAAATLATLESRFPETIQTSSVKHLAGVVAARTGSDVFTSIDVPAIPMAQATPAPTPTLKSPEQLRNLTQLSENLQRTPATKAEAIVLKGDVLTIRGDTSGATRAYREATLAPASTPVTRERLRQIERAAQP